LPLLGIALSNRENKTASAIFDAHCNALLSGKRHSLVRFWKKKGDGLMTERDKAHGFSYESRYSIFGIITWNGLVSEQLPRWALPMDHEHFTLEGLSNDRHDLRL
jgi:hypothetical protein